MYKSVQTELRAGLIEVEVATGADVQIHVRAMVAESVDTYGGKKYRMGMCLTRYKEELPHGAWGKALSAITRISGIAERTLQEAMADYERVKDVEVPIIQALQQAGIDPAAKRQTKVVEMASAEHKAGAPPAQAVQTAVAAKRKPVAAAKPQLTIDGRGLSQAERDAILIQVERSQNDRWVQVVRESIRKAFRKIPENRRAEIFRLAAGEELWIQVPSREPITIVPTEPTPDRATA